MKWTDEYVEEMIALILKYGVAVVASLAAVGVGLLLSQHGFDSPNYQTFHAGSASLAPLSSVLKGVIKGHGTAFIELAVELLIWTVVLRVAFQLVAFIHQRNLTYTLVTLIVLGVLLYSTSRVF
jgi:uncharacterized membrane protein